MLPVGYGELDPTATTNMFDMLMGKSESAQRRTWLEEKGNLAEVDI
jgi:topoisomerase-4 subunit B